jgi:hypothetical protein
MHDSPRALTTVRRWTCTINAPKNKSNGNYTVKVSHSLFL